VPDDHNPQSARRAAEALFKPLKQLPASDTRNTQAEIATTANPQPAREPRILPIPQPQPEPEQPTVLKLGKKRGRPPAFNGSRLPKSEHGRIRTLATYGMTIAQVAEVYGVAESEIEGIVEA
jgi:hypothetical protein